MYIYKCTYTLKIRRLIMPEYPMILWSNLHYPNPFDQLHNLSAWISKKVLIIESSCMYVQLTTPTPKKLVYITDLLSNSMFHPILAENNSSLTLYRTFLNAILVLQTVVSTSIGNDGVLHSTTHAHIDIAPDICILICTFAWLKFR